MNADEKMEKELEEYFHFYKFFELVGYGPEEIEQFKNRRRAEYIEFRTRPDETIEKVPDYILLDDLLDDLPHNEPKVEPIEVGPFERYQPLALWVARKFQQYYNTSLWEDINHEALLSLLAAIETYNPTSERQTIERYIVVVVRNNLLNFVYGQKDLIDISVSQRSLDQKIKSAIDSGLSHEQIVEKFKKFRVTENRILDALMRPEVVYLEDDKNVGLPLLNKLVSPDPVPEWLDLDSDLVAALKTLKPPEYTVLCLYHELWCQVPMPLDWPVGGKFKAKKPTFLIVGATLGIPEPTVKKRYYNALKKLAKYFGYS